MVKSPFQSIPLQCRQSRFSERTSGLPARLLGLLGALVLASASAPSGARASEESPGVFSCNLEFRGQAPEAIRRVHACRQGVLFAMRKGDREGASSLCRGEFGEHTQVGAVYACMAGVRNFFATQ